MNKDKLRELLEKQDELRTERELVVEKGDYEAARELRDEIDTINDEILSILGETDGCRKNKH